MFNDLYRGPIAKDIDRKKIIQAKAALETEKLSKLAAKLIRSEAFETYKNEALEARENLYREIEDFVCHDPIMYAMTIQSLVSQAKVWTSIIRKVESDAGRKKKDNGEPEAIN